MRLSVTLIMSERRRLNRMAERDVGDWLYARFLAEFAGTPNLRIGDVQVA
jgi:exoribonuclease-2